MTDRAAAVALGVIDSMSSDENRGHGRYQVVQSPPTVDDDGNAKGDLSTRSASQSGFAAPSIPYIVPAIHWPEPRTSFRTLQAWEGVVMEVAGDSFAARLVDITNGGPDEEADVSFDEISDDERELVKAGAVFLLHVGYATSEGGQRSRVAILRFRRLPVWTDPELASARNTAREQASRIRWR